MTQIQSNESNSNDHPEPSDNTQTLPQLPTHDQSETPKVEQAQSANDQGDNGVESAFYEVEKILYKRPKQDKWEYRVKWLFYPPSANSWVSFDDLSPACQRLVKDTHSSIPTYKKYRR